jgi:Domain of unknown function (DUF4352)
MNNHHDTPSTSSSSPQDAAGAAVLSSAQANSEKAGREAIRPWFRKKRLILPLAVILGFLIMVAVSSSRHTATITSPPKATAAAVAGIGTRVRDGTFEFVVTGVEHPGRTFAGKVGETLTAKGEFVIVRVDVTNVGSQEQRLGCSCQVLFSEKGQKITPSPAILRTKDALKYVAYISPGDTVKGAAVLFDVPPGTTLRSIELHASPSSPGVKVTLS